MKARLKSVECVYQKAIDSSEPMTISDEYSRKLRIIFESAGKSYIAEFSEKDSKNLFRLIEAFISVSAVMEID